MTSKLYTREWRDKVRPGAQRSAEALVPILIDTLLLDPHEYQLTMVDVGAGEGWFTDEFATHGIDTTKVDGPWVDDVVTIDFEHPPYPELPRHDLALCLEVAEHVTPAHADDLIAWLCTLAPVVVFSAAIPRQGGKGHVNEQPPGYWAERFAYHGYAGSGALRWQIWDNEQIEPWYRQNLLVFGDHQLPVDGCPYVVHPGIWSVYR